MNKTAWLWAGRLVISAASVAGAVDMETVPVGNADNGPDGTGYGAVDYEYQIGKFEVTVGQYTEFLNAVAADDTYGLYHPDMLGSIYGCKITQSGDPGGYTYTAPGDRVDRPVNYVDFGDAARFVNWLHNGQLTGAQDATTTEDGSYTLNGAVDDTPLMAVTRNPDATWVIPTEDEWYKAAYHQNNGVTGDYYLYATSSDTPPANEVFDPDVGNTATHVVEVEPGVGEQTLGYPYYVTPVGEHENSPSPYGTFDQNGNVWEWNEAIGDDQATRGNRSGSFGSWDADLQSSYRDYFKAPTRNFFSMGLRVACVGAQGPDCHIGDANGDGEVGIADLSALADNYGATGATWRMGDFNDDGEVGIADLSALADNYGWKGEPCNGATVPEPATMLLLTLGAAGMAMARRR